ncbi:hypothetical protein C8R43DRAFT_965127 [Mycena crocata]|nr:hypothetical protein C8R43DRAFT_965127 [Mycena crocata]
MSYPAPTTAILFPPLLHRRLLLPAMISLLTSDPRLGRLAKLEGQMQIIESDAEEMLRYQTRWSRKREDWREVVLRKQTKNRGELALCGRERNAAHGSVHFVARNPCRRGSRRSPGPPRGAPGRAAAGAMLPSKGPVKISAQ